MLIDINRTLLNANQHLEAVLDLRRLDFVARPQITPCIPATIKILMVADSGITFGSDAFGLQKVIDSLKTPVYDFVYFDIQFAHRQQGASREGDPYNPTYTNFRFDRKDSDGKYTIDQYDQIWCFAFAVNEDALSDSELEVLARWMDDENRQGGILAMGDHDELGAAMCSKIPRVSTMRYWRRSSTPGEFTVPPAIGPSRYDTNRPATLGQRNIAGNPDIIPFDNQKDAVPQPIEVKQYPLQPEVVIPASYWPHPILCDPEKGSINVLPDHAHEGRVVEDRDIKLSTDYQFNQYKGLHYPSNENGYRPVPEVIAWANTLADPPYRHEKGATAAKRFGLVSVYDGNQAGVGRVVVDTTWHHWLNINLEGLESGNPEAYALIQSYFRNVGIWLARGSLRRRMLCSALWNSVFTAEAMEAYSTTTPIEVLGNQARSVLRKHIGGCMLLDWMQVWLIPSIQIEIEQLYIEDPLCLTCPPIARIQEHLLGGVIQEMLPLRDELIQANQQVSSPVVEPVQEVQVMAALDRGIQNGFSSFSTAYNNTVERGLAVQPLMNELFDNGLSAS